MDKLRTVIRLMREALNAAEDALADIELEADGAVSLDETTFNGIIAELRQVSSTGGALLPTSRKTRTNRAAAVRRRR